jgi:hypothetical protein
MDDGLSYCPLDNNTNCCCAQVAVGARLLLSVRDRSRRTCRATTDTHVAAQCLQKRLWCNVGGIDDVEAKARFLLQCGTRHAPEAAAHAARSPNLRFRSPADLHAALHFLASRGWRVERARMDVLRRSLEWLAARVLFAELHRCATMRAHALQSVELSGEVDMHKQALVLFVPVLSQHA